MPKPEIRRLSEGLGVIRSVSQQSRAASEDREEQQSPKGLVSGIHDLEGRKLLIQPAANRRRYADNDGNRCEMQTSEASE
jgi:hypothetical protein